MKIKEFIEARKNKGAAAAKIKKTKILSQNNGFVLVLVLLVVAAMLALAVDFAYGVYVNISGLHNINSLQYLSVEGSSLIDSSANAFLQALSQGMIPMDGQDMNIPIDDGTKVHFLAADESAKFSLNSIVQPNGDLNKDAYQAFKRLLSALKLDEGIADKVVFWINPNSLPQSSLSGNLKNTKKAPLDSTEELKLFIDEASYDTLKNYVTVYGDGLVNINSAQAPVLMSLSDEMSPGLAERIIERRKLEAFKNTGELSQVAGFEKLGMLLAPEITVTSAAIRVTASATREGLDRTVECVMDPQGKVLFWREN